MVAHEAYELEDDGDSKPEQEPSTGRESARGKVVN